MMKSITDTYNIFYRLSLIVNNENQEDGNVIKENTKNFKIS